MIDWLSATRMHSPAALRLAHLSCRHPQRTCKRRLGPLSRSFCQMWRLIRGPPATSAPSRHSQPGEHPGNIWCCHIIKSQSFCKQPSSKASAAYASSGLYLVPTLASTTRWLVTRGELGADEYSNGNITHHPAVKVKQPLGSIINTQMSFGAAGHGPFPGSCICRPTSKPSSDADD